MVIGLLMSWIKWSECWESTEKVLRMKGIDGRLLEVIKSEIEDDLSGFNNGGRPVRQIFPPEVHGDPQTDWMEQTTFKYQFRDRVKWAGRSGPASGEIMEGYRAPDSKVSYSVRVDCGWDVVVVVPEELLEKIDDN